MRHWTTCTSTSVIALIIAGAANAQAVSPDSATQVSTVDEVVVTAQRRSENLRDVPIAITVVSGQSLRETGASSLSDITQRAPSVQFTPVPQTPSFSVRGVASNSFDYSVESAVGLAVDDVNLTLPRYTPLNSLADVERVEVLRGPQGLLFGKNTTAGLISVTTRRPILGEYSTEGRVQYGQRDQLQAHAIVNLPVGESAALRLRAGRQSSDTPLQVRGPGSIEDQRSYNLNAKLLWNLTDRLSVYAIADYQDTQGDPGVWTIRSFGGGANAPAAGNGFVRDQLTALGIRPGPENRATGIGAHNYSRTDSFGGQVTIDYELGGATITSVTAYRDVRQNSNLEVDSTPLRVYDNNLATLDAHQFTQELRIASNGERRFDYVAGLYYYQQEISAGNAQYGTLGYLPNASPILIGTVGGLVTYEVNSKSIAAFAQGTLHLTDRFDLIVGGRYTRDEIDNTASVSAIPGVCNVSYALTGGRVCQPRPLPYSEGASRSEEGWSGRAVLQHRLTDRANVYISASRGYKGPAISAINANVFPVDPETVEAYEAGVKGDFLGRRLSVNAAIFYNDFTNFQAQVFDPTIPPIGAFRTGNAGGLRTQGVELEGVIRPTSGWSISAGATYLDAEYTNYFPSCYAGQTAAQGCTFPGPTFDAKGHRLIAAPEWSTSLATSYERSLSGARLFVNADWSYRSSVYYGVGNPDTLQKGYSLVNGTVGISDPDDRIRLSLFVRNLFDQRFAAVIFPSYFDTGGTSQILPDTAFRRIGAAVEWRF